MQAGRRYDYAYRLHWLSLPPDAKLLARVAATRIGRSPGGERRLIVVDFDHMGTVPRAVHAEVSASAGAIANVNGQAIAPTHQYRASFELDPQNDERDRAATHADDAGRAVERDVAVPLDTLSAAERRRRARLNMAARMCRPRPRWLCRHNRCAAFNAARWCALHSPCSSRACSPSAALSPSRASARYEMYAVVDIGGITALEWIMVGLFAITFGWISLSAVACVTGVLLGWQRRRAPQEAPLAGRTALVMPVYNENPARTFAALQAMAEALVAEGRAAAFELFILSDTTNAEIWIAETAAYRRLRAALGSDIAVWYRRRYENTSRKAGNIQDFVERWGGRYDYMIVLDADSMMSAQALVTLVQEMQADERVGILQTVPALANGQGLLPRLQQFASRLYGPVVARGLAAWQGPDGNYWGHNAIIRVRAFAESCGLPALRGVKPFGGAILSHDFVEAALIRRAGWSVRMLSGVEGSWEDGPPSLLDVAARDRRWAQGNLQHLAVLPARGLAWPSRMHLLMGVMSYLASPLWLLLIIVGVTLTLQAAFIRPEYFAADFQLFPSWPRFDAERMIRLFAITMGVLLLPKLIGLLRAFCVRALRGPVGIVRLAVGAVVELILSALYAPIMMIIQCRQLWEILRGHDSGWSAQRRGDGTDALARDHPPSLVADVDRHRAQRRSRVPVSARARLDVADTRRTRTCHPVVASERESARRQAVAQARTARHSRGGRRCPPLMQRRAELESGYSELVEHTTIESLLKDSIGADRALPYPPATAARTSRAARRRPAHRTRQGRGSDERATKRSHGSRPASAWRFSATLRCSISSRSATAEWQIAPSCR